MAVARHRIDDLTAVAARLVELDRPERRETSEDQAVGVLVAATLPRVVGVAEVDRQAGLDGELQVLGRLLAAIPGEPPAKLLYLAPPKRAIVLSLDEKTQIQAPDRSQPMLPLRPGQVIDGYEGRPGHEIVLVYHVELADADRFAADESAGRESDGSPFTARWLALADVRRGAARLYPEGLLQLLEGHEMADG